MYTKKRAEEHIGPNVVLRTIYFRTPPYHYFALHSSNSSDCIAKFPRVLQGLFVPFSNDIWRFHSVECLLILFSVYIKTKQKNKKQTRNGVRRPLVLREHGHANLGKMVDRQMPIHISATPTSPIGSKGSASAETAWHRCCHRTITERSWRQRRISVVIPPPHLSSLFNSEVFLRRK